MQAESVVEERYGVARAVGNESVKSSVQLFGKIIFVLVPVHQIVGPMGFDLMAPLLQCCDGAWFGKLLARKYQSDVAPLVSQRHPAGKRTLAGHPADIDTLREIHPCAAGIEFLVTQGLSHLPQTSFCVRPRGFCNETDDSRHSSSC